SYRRVVVERPLAGHTRLLCGKAPDQPLDPSALRGLRQHSASSARSMDAEGNSVAELNLDVDLALGLQSTVHICVYTEFRLTDSFTLVRPRNTCLSFV